MNKTDQLILARSMSIQDLRNGINPEISDAVRQEEIGRRETIVWSLPTWSPLRQEILAGMAD
jgi:hypothetical protein